MYSQKKIFTAMLAISAGLAVAACNEEKTAAKPDDKSTTATAMDKAKDMAAKIEDKVEAAAGKAKDMAAKIEDKVEAKFKDAAKDMAAKVDAAKDAAQPAAKEVVVAAPAVEAAKPAAAAPAAKEEAKTAEAAPAAAAAPEAKPAEVAPAASAAPEVKAEAKPAEAAPAAAAAPVAGASPENAEVQAAAKEQGVEFKDGRYRDKDGHPTPVVTKDFKIDWAGWQGFRRYHDACHVCHGPNALGSTFAPSLAESLKTMDYETFFGTVVGGRVVDRAGTKYVMPAFGEDKNIMCYIDDIYTYIKARSNNMASEGKAGMPAGRPNGREDISPETKKAVADCTG